MNAKRYFSLVLSIIILLSTALSACDAEIEPTKREVYNICDNCMECVKGCPGGAIDDKGNLDTWRCAVYYNGANGSKNPFMPPEAYIDFPDRLDIISGEAKMDTKKAKEIINNTYFFFQCINC